MGLFDKFKKKAKGGIEHVAQDAKAEVLIKKEVGLEEMGFQRVDEFTYEPNEWEYYYMQPDNWGGMNSNDFDEFMFRYFTVEEAEGEGDLAQALSQFGYKSKQEWLHIICTFFRYHFGQGGKIPRDDVDINFSDPAWTQAGYNARMRQQQANQQQAMQADPNLTAPVEGVTVEQWAAASAQIAALAANPTAMAQALAQLGMDKAKYDRINAAFQQKMQGDTTGSIATIFGKAFSQAQGMQGGYGMGAVDGSAKQLGQEPVSMEKYAEINGAMSAWAEQGADVNANLQQVFGIAPAELSKYGAYWSTKFTSDIQLMQTYGEMLEKYSQRYSGPDLDDDLDKI